LKQTKVEEGARGICRGGEKVEDQSNGMRKERRKEGGLARKIPSRAGKKRVSNDQIKKRQGVGDGAGSPYCDCQGIYMKNIKTSEPLTWSTSTRGRERKRVIRTNKQLYRGVKG